jgi:hypothetical protein
MFVKPITMLKKVDEFNLKAMKKTNNAQTTEKLKPKWTDDPNGKNGGDQFRTNFRRKQK